MDQRKQEIEALRLRYGEVEHGENLDWIIFKQFCMPHGWRQEEIELLIVIPPGYPATPPDNFYVRDGLRLADGAPPSNYSEGQNILGGRWAQFSFHAKSWNPDPDREKGDSILTFMLAVEQRLGEGA